MCNVFPRYSLNTKECKATIHQRLNPRIMKINQTNFAVGYDACHMFCTNINERPLPYYTYRISGVLMSSPKVEGILSGRIIITIISDLVHRK